MQRQWRRCRGGGHLRALLHTVAALGLVCTHLASNGHAAAKPFGKWGKGKKRKYHLSHAKLAGSDDSKGTSGITPQYVGPLAVACL